MGIPYRNVVLALRRWNQQQTQSENLTREERFSIEKAYFPRLEEKNSFSEIKAQIVQETGLNPWEVSRYLDLLQDGEKKLRNVAPVTSDTGNRRLGGVPEIPVRLRSPVFSSAPADCGTNRGLPKQVYKVLLPYRLSRFREKWG